MRRELIACAALLVAACGGDGDAGAETERVQSEPHAAATEAGPPVNLLTLAEGAVVVSASANAVAAWSLVDGDTESSWSNGGPRYPGPHAFVFELRAPTRLTDVGIDNAGARPRGVAGGAAGRVRVEGSNESATAGFTLIATIDPAADGETLAAVSVQTPVRWLRFTVERPQDAAATWIYFDEVIAHGAQTPPEGERFTGVFQIRPREFVELRQTGASVSGCFVEGGGHAVGDITGSVVDGVARLAWRRTDLQGVDGVALLVIDSRGYLNGVRYRDRSRSVWAGGPAPQGTVTPCSRDVAAANPVAEALEEQGEVRLYGILFDFDQATIKSSSEPALRQLLEALQANATMNVDIEGHTDNAGEDAYNLALSERRAHAVVAWLTRNGVAASRLNAVGRGETAPVADNATADGRALNRRVEVRRR